MTGPRPGGDEEPVEELYRRLAAHTTDVVVARGLDDVITWVSPSVVWSCGWERAEVVGRRVADLVHPGDRADLGTARRALERHEPAVVRVRLLTPRGPLRVRMRECAVLDEFDRVVAVEAGWRAVDEVPPAGA